MIFKLMFMFVYSIFSISFFYELKQYNAPINYKIICGALFLSLSILILHIMNIKEMLNV